MDRLFFQVPFLHDVVFFRLKPLWRSFHHDTNLQKNHTTLEKTVDLYKGENGAAKQKANFLGVRKDWADIVFCFIYRKFHAYWEPTQL
jgi:hypothetical protein